MLHEVLTQGFVFPNEIEVLWSLMIVLYPYITGLVAGAFIVSSLYHVFGKDELKPVAKFSLVAAFSFLLFACTPLLFHLGHPERAFNIMFTPHFYSAMSGFGYIYSFYLIVVLLEIWFVFRPDIIARAKSSTGIMKALYWVLALGSMDDSEEALHIDHKITMVLAAIGIPSACTLHGYVGFLFGSLKSNPWWSTPLMPVIFLMSAIVSGIAILILSYYIVMVIKKQAVDNSCLKSMYGFLWGFFIIDLTLEFLNELASVYAQNQSHAILALLIRGKAQFQLYHPADGHLFRDSPGGARFCRAQAHVRYAAQSPGPHLLGIDSHTGFSHALECRCGRPAVFKKPAGPDELYADIPWP